MLTSFFSEFIPLVSGVPVGLISFWVDKDTNPILVVKASKEFILTAKVHQNFKIYVVPIILKNICTIGLISAFFDDIDEPLIILSPIFNDYASKTLDLLQ
jgi:hypothetical protein